MQTSTHGNNFFGLGMFGALIISVSLVIVSWNGKNFAKMKRWEKEASLFAEELKIHNQAVITEIFGE